MYISLTGRRRIAVEDVQINTTDTKVSTNYPQSMLRVTVTRKNMQHKLGNEEMYLLS